MPSSSSLFCRCFGLLSIILVIGNEQRNAREFPTEADLVALGVN